ncbi:MAG: flagellar basal body P-ring formation protein FlgA [Firmicutes bacterium]|nr:flagellar basal body P-ring formation protein FlgA [Bacillota bacterium]
MRKIAGPALLSVLLWLVVSAPVLGAPWLAVVRIHPKPHVAGPEIYLGEIADVEASDETLAGQLEGLAVGRAALPGQARQLSVGTIRVRMRQAGLPEELILIQAPALSFGVQTRAQRIPGEELRAAAEHAVRRAARDELAMACDDPGDATVMIGAKTVVPDRLIGTPPGPVVAALEIRIDGNLVRTVMVRCETRVKRNVWVTTATVKRHQVLDDTAVALERRELAVLPRGLLEPGSGSLEGLRATRPLAPGTVLTEAMVEPVPAVWRGKPVEIVARLGPVEVRAPGVALEDGRPGDIVRVENDASGQVLQALVVDGETVEALIR